MIVLLSSTGPLPALSPVLTRASGDPDNSGNPRGDRTRGRNKEEGKYSLIIIRNSALAEKAWIIQHALSVSLKEPSAAINKTEVERYLLIWNNCQHLLLSKKIQALCLLFYKVVYTQALGPEDIENQDKWLSQGKGLSVGIDLFFNLHLVVLFEFFIKNVWTINHELETLLGATVTSCPGDLLSPDGEEQETEASWALKAEEETSGKRSVKMLPRLTFVTFPIPLLLCRLVSFTYYHKESKRDPRKDSA